METATSQSVRVPNPDSLLAHPGLLGYVGARLLGLLGVEVLAVCVGWQAYSLTHRPLTLGLIGLVQFVPVLCLVFVTGQVADRFDRRRVVTVCTGAQALCALVFALGTWRGFLSIPLLYGLLALFAVAKAFERPSVTALLPGLVPPALFPRATAFATSAMETTSIVGPAVGGLLWMAGSGLSYFVCAGLLGLAALTISRVRFEQAPRPRGPVTLDGVFGGLAFIRSRPQILGAISLDLFAVLFGGATALLPVYALDILHGSPLALGLLRGAPAIGALAASAWLARRPLGGRAGPKMFAAVVLFGLGTVGFGVSRSLPLSIALLAAIGAADVVSMVVRQTLVQLRTPDEIRGRVSAVNGLFISTSNQLGEFESGSLAAVIGTVPSVVAGGIGTVLVALLWMRLFPSLGRLDRLETAQG